MLSLLGLDAQPFHLETFLTHLFFEGIADAGGYWASRFCQHTWHRVTIAVGFALVATYVLTTFVG